MKRNFSVGIHLGKPRLLQRADRWIETDGGFEIWVKQRGRDCPVRIEGYVSADGRLTITVGAGGLARLKVHSLGETMEEVTHV